MFGGKAVPQTGGSVQLALLGFVALMSLTVADMPPLGNCPSGTVSVFETDWTTNITNGEVSVHLSSVTNSYTVGLYEVPNNPGKMVFGRACPDLTIGQDPFGIRFEGLPTNRSSLYYFWHQYLHGSWDGADCPNPDWDEQVEWWIGEAPGSMTSLLYTTVGQTDHDPDATFCFPDSWDAVNSCPHEWNVGIDVPPADIWQQQALDDGSFRGVGGLKMEGWYNTTTSDTLEIHFGIYNAEACPNEDTSFGRIKICVDEPESITTPGLDGGDDEGQNTTVGTLDDVDDVDDEEDDIAADVDSDGDGNENGSTGGSGGVVPLVQENMALVGVAGAVVVAVVIGAFATRRRGSSDSTESELLAESIASLKAAAPVSSSVAQRKKSDSPVKKRSTSPIKKSSESPVKKQNGSPTKRTGSPMKRMKKQPSFKGSQGGPRPRANSDGRPRTNSAGRPRGRSVQKGGAGGTGGAGGAQRPRPRANSRVKPGAQPQPAPPSEPAPQLPDGPRPATVQLNLPNDLLSS